jgi:hypothetical protein
VFPKSVQFYTNVRSASSAVFIGGDLDGSVYQVQGRALNSFMASLASVMAFSVAASLSRALVLICGCRNVEETMN